MKELNNLVVAIFARADMDRKETGDGNLSPAESKVKNNIVQGRAVDPVAGIPSKYIPDWAALHEQREAMGADDWTDAWVAMNTRRQRLHVNLSRLWNSGDYAGMVALMNKASEPVAE